MLFPYLRPMEITRGSEWLLSRSDTKVLGEVSCSDGRPSTTKAREGAGLFLSFILSLNPSFEIHG